MTSETAAAHASIDFKAGTDGIVSQNSFSADSPYFDSHVENEIRHIAIMHDTLHDIASRTKTFGKCGSLMSEATRRLAVACRLRRPYTTEDDKDIADREALEREDIEDRRRALGEEMASLLGVMAEVSCYDSFLE